MQASIKIFAFSDCAPKISYAHSCMPSLFQNQFRDHPICSYAALYKFKSRLQVIEFIQIGVTNYVRNMVYPEGKERHQIAF